MIKKISIIGGDLRIVKLSEMLLNEGAEVFTYGMENAEEQFEPKKCETLDEATENADVILGPLPFSSDSKTINAPFSKEKIFIEDLINRIKGKILIAGSIKANVYEIAKKNNVEIIDLMKREELCVLNAISTAEGTIKIAIEETSKTLHGSNILIMGFGRIGKVLAKMLDGLGANVSCEARKNTDLAWIKAYGYEPISLDNLGYKLEKFDIIINTIPYIVLNEEKLNKVKKDSLIIDLASNPGGVDRNVVKQKNIKFIWALSLPGKIAPVTSAEFIKETLYNIFNEIK